ncbi:DUF4188 domain-containing protein [Streptomyces sp. NPDC002643]
MFGKPIAAGRTTADAEGDVVVLLIGMRINHFWAVRHWWPVLRGMFVMLSELKKDKERGLLSSVLLTASPRTYYVVQYWESKEKLYGYAHDPEAFHRKAWAAMNRRRRAAKGAAHVGLWHEAYVVPEGAYEAVYAGMPASGLAAAHGQVPVERRGGTAAERFGYRAPKRVGAAEGA